jgi:hypothetical protein
VISGVVAHGGLVGAIAEAFVAVAVTGVFVVIWLRERSARKEEARAGLKDPDDQTS